MNNKQRTFVAMKSLNIRAHTWSAFLFFLAFPLLSFADEKLNCAPGLHQFTDTKQQAPQRFTVTWTTTADPEDDIVIEVIREWSPLGADRFYQLVLDNFFNCATFFRVVPGFVIQFGLAAEPEETAKWDHAIVDDPFNVQSNTQGTLSFAMAGPGTRTSQIFVNLNDNPDLDYQGFTPFARVISGSFANRAERVKEIDEEGNKWILAEFPDIDLILSTTYKSEENDVTPAPAPGMPNEAKSSQSEASNDAGGANTLRNVQIGIAAVEAAFLLFFYSLFLMTRSPDQSKRSIALRAMK